MSDTKFTGFEAYLIEQGLIIVKGKWIEELNAMMEDGKRPIMTPGFIEITVKEALEKLELLTFR